MTAMTAAQTAKLIKASEAMRQALVSLMISGCVSQSLRDTGGQSIIDEANAAINVANPILNALVPA